MSQQGSAFVVVAQIAEAIQPLARGAKYEDPLHAALQGAGLGSVTGGGSILGERYQVQSADIELKFCDLNGALQFARSKLLEFGAPGGSLLLFLRDGCPRALAVTTNQEFDHPPTLDALARRLVAPGLDPDDEDELRERVAATAQKILKDFEGLWAGRYEYPTADLSAYSAEWLQWYDQVAESLASQGLVFAGDIATMRIDLPTPKTHGFSRKFLAANCIMRADVFQLAATKPKSPVQVVVLKSEFEDGRFLGTSNAVLKWNVPDFIDDERLHPESPPQNVAARHVERLSAYRNSHAATPLRMTSLADLLASEQRERSRTRQFRQAQQVPAQIELERLGALPDFAARVHLEMRRLKGL